MSISRKRVIMALTSSVIVILCIALVVFVLPYGITITSEGKLAITCNNVMAALGWENPTSDTANGWANPTYAYDDETTLYASYTVQAVWSPYLELYISAIDCTKVRAYCSRVNRQVTDQEVDVYYSGAWQNIYSGSPQVDAYYEYEIGSTESVTGMRFRFNSSKSGRWAGVNDADFWEVSADPDIANAPTTWTMNGLMGSGVIQIDTIYYANPQGDTQAPASTVADADCNFTITNSSTMAIDLTCTMGSFSGGDANMTNSDTGANGATTYGAYSWFSGILYANKVIIKSVGSDVGYDGLPATTDIKWGVEVETQTNEWAGGNSSTATLTITATID